MTGSTRSCSAHDRRAVLKILAASSLAVLGADRGFSAPSAGFVSEIAPGVYVHKGQHGLFTPETRGDIANCGFVVGKTAVAVIDTGGAAKIGASLLAAIRTVTDLPVRYVVNTHMHPDHVFGNAAFEGPDVAICGHAKLARGLSARSERYLSLNRERLGEEAFLGTKIILPTLAVSDVMTLDLGGRTLELQAQKTAHTDNDLIVRCTTTGTVFMGDLLFSEHIPTLDGSIRGWLALLTAMKGVAAERVVPGHGPVAMPWPEAQVPIHRYLDLVATEVKAMIGEGKSLEQAVEVVGLSERTAWVLFEEYHARNVSATFAELEWE